MSNTGSVNTQPAELTVSDIRAIARDRLLPLTHSHADLPGVNRPLVSELAACGLLQRLFPQSLGGFLYGERVDAVTLCRMREGLGYESSEAESAFALQGLGSYPILQSGSELLRRTWIPEVAQGKAIAAFALTEPDSGSDAASLALSAERDGDGFRLTGVKRWISNAPEADFYTVFARTGGEGAKGVTAFVVPGDSPGLTGTPLRMLVPHAIGELRFDGVYVSRDKVLGELGSGFRVAMQTLDLFRPSVGAYCLGMAGHALEYAITHAKTREAFGKPIQEFQAVSHRLADMATQLEAARLLVYEAADAYNHESPRLSLLSAMSKLFASEVAHTVVDGAVQIHGAKGIEFGHPVEQLYREARAPRIYEGTSEIQRTIIARQVLR